MNPYYRCFEASDGFVAVACLNLAQRQAFLELFGLEDATIDAPDVVPERRRRARREGGAHGLRCRRVRRALGRRVDRSARVGRRAVRPRAAARGDRFGSAGGRRRPCRASLTAGPRRDRPALAVRASGRRRRALQRRRRPSASTRNPSSRSSREVPGLRRAHAVRRVRARRDRRLACALRAGARELAGRSRRRPRCACLRSGLVGAVGCRGASRRRRGGRNRARTRSRARQSPRRSDARGSAVRRGQGEARTSSRSRWPFRCERVGSVSDRRLPKPDPSPRSTAPERFASRSTRSDSSSPSRRRRAGVRGTQRRSGTSRVSAERALELAVEHARAREQFGAPLAALPAVQSRLADAALATDAITLLAWAAAANAGGLQEPELRFAGSACCDVTAASHQVHGAVGFALETGLHVYHRRARSAHAWATAACDAAR